MRTEEISFEVRDEPRVDGSNQYVLKVTSRSRSVNGDGSHIEWYVRESGEWRQSGIDHKYSRPLHPTWAVVPDALLQAMGGR